jgi:hypothetical protein
VLQEGDSCGCPELRSVVQLQARVGEVCALFRTDCLPGPGVGGFGARFLRLKFHKKNPVRSFSSIRVRRVSHKQRGQPSEVVHFRLPLSLRCRAAYLSQMNSPRGWLLSSCLAVALTACPRGAPEPKVSSDAPRPFVMGFSVIPPKPDIKIAVRSMEIWTQHADAAIMHLDVPWGRGTASLLDLSGSKRRPLAVACAALPRGIVRC